MAERPGVTRCLNCNREGEDISPLGKPRRDGSRVPFSFCYACLALVQTGVRLRGGGREAKRRGSRDSMRRTRAA